MAIHDFSGFPQQGDRRNAAFSAAMNAAYSAVPSIRGDDENTALYAAVAEALDGRSGPVFNVMAAPYGAKGDGVTDDSAAIQAAITAAGVGGRVFFPPGQYYCGTTTLNGLTHQTWEGGGYQLGVGGTAVTQLIWAAGAQNGVNAGVNQVFRRLLFRGAGKLNSTGAAIATGVSPQSSNHSRFDWCQFYSWAQAVNATNAFYTLFDTCEFAFVGVGILAASCYNMHLVNCTARLNDAGTGTGGILFDTSTAIRHLHISGGSLEGFSSSGGIVLAGSGSLVTLDSLYWESSVAGTNAFGVDVRADDNTVVAIGNMVYLTEINRWINMSGRDKSSLVALGNKFVCANTSSTNPIAYVLPANTTGGSIDMAGDSWDDVALAGAAWANGSLSTIPPGTSRIAAPRAWSVIHGNAQYIARGIVPTPQTTAPTTPRTGSLWAADNSGWDPLNRTGVDPYLVWWDGTRFSPVGVPTFTGSTTWDPPSVAAGAQTTTTVTVTGAALGDTVTVSFSLDVQAMQLTGYVSSSNTVTVVLSNGTAGAIDLASGTLRATAIRY